MRVFPVMESVQSPVNERPGNAAPNIRPQNRRYVWGGIMDLLAALSPIEFCTNS